MGERNTSQHRTLRAMGITIFGVIISTASTVAFGLSAAWHIRVAAGVGVAAFLVAAVKVGTREGSHGFVARAADWMTGQSGDDQ